MGIPYNHVPMEQVLYCEWLWQRPFASHFVVKSRVPSSSLSHAAGFLASKATFDSKSAVRHNLRIQLRLSIFQSIEHPKGCSVALYGGMGCRCANLDFNPANRSLRSRIKVAKGGAAFQSDPSDGKVSCHVSDMSKHR